MLPPHGSTTGLQRAHSSDSDPKTPPPQAGSKFRGVSSPPTARGWDPGRRQLSHRLYAAGITQLLSHLCLPLHQTPAARHPSQSSAHFLPEDTVQWSCFFCSLKEVQDSPLSEPNVCPSAQWPVRVWSHQWHNSSLRGAWLLSQQGRGSQGDR